MKIPQIIMIIIFAMNIGINLAKHGEPKDSSYNIVMALVDVAVEFAILKAGGFF